MTGFYGFHFDATYILVLVGAVLCMAASAKLNSTYGKYAKVRCMSGMTGAEAAVKLLNNAGIHDVRVERVRGELTDHYDPRNKVLRLSDSTYGATSVAAIGVAAHECGHALQHKEGYFPLKFRAFLVPAANIGSRLGLPLVILSLVMGLGSLARIGVWVFAIAVLFQVVTLPVEFNASGRALRMVESYGIMNADEVDDCKRVLGAAALTYVAAAASSVLQLLRLLILTGNRRRDD